MSLSRTIASAVRPAVRARGYASAVAHSPIIRSELAEGAVEKSAFLKDIAAVEAHGRHTAELWRKISYFVCIPGIAVCAAWVYNLEQAHHEHIEHRKHENDGVYPQPPAYDYLNRRIVPYPWGNNSLFYNPEIQRNMDEAD
ncbi:mitochondrial cytochrome c oxidase subunit VIa [Cylindrobasidium torrendii FP15055 ss-10]|uniref:Mitochondrial cytochrome c oxidase subunit VIa n=1 Tax=Cylindrobasidium torrendii FP15055 ss-10 TaxID=1314674 RepID=A0A0D7AZ68_9AGAR|nr:mitochondrial cytochrome c oxidase subunit VIa [Cylindrobasidium torrendii FP15055 ss-10]